MLGALFGKKKKETPNPTGTIQNLQTQIDLLNKKVEFLGKKIENELITAKKNATKNKTAAKMALKRKVLYENQRNKIEGTIFSLEQQKISLEGLSGDMQVINVMREVSQTMQGITNKMSVDDVDDTMDDIRDQMDVANSISDAISTPLGSDLFDEEDLDQQLADLEDENIDDMLQTSGLPNAPQSNIPKKQPVIEDEDEEFRALEQEMN